MRKTVILFAALLLSMSAFAQLEVKKDSFKEVVGFVNINTDKMYDDNEKPYAVLKVKTENINDKQRRELLFQGDARTFIECEYKVGEVWLYMSYYASYLKISHPDFSSTEFTFPFDMEPKKGYELTLVNKAFTAAVPAKEQYNYLIVKADQPNAVISIDGQYAGEGEASQFFKVGETHTWSIECNLYHPESGSATIVKENAVTIDKTLRPAFGYLNVTTKPESGATVFIDNTRIGETPCKSGKLASGQHKVRVMKEMYATTEQTFTVTDGNTVEAAMNMAANYVNITVTTDAQSDIYIDNDKKGKGTWSGRLAASEHFMEAKKASHKTTVKTVMLTLGKDENIVIPDPTPIYGTLNVNSSPMGAKITIDGKDYGTTPKILDEILIGTHEVKLEKAGMATITRQITIDEINMALINEKLMAANAQNNQQTAQTPATNNKPTTLNPSLSQGLIAYYPFDGNANDYSGNGMHANPQNDYRYENGVVGQAIHLQGKGYESSSSVQGGHVLLPKLDFGNSGFTFNLWIKAEGLSKSDGECYINFGNDTEQERLYIIQNQSNIRFCYNKVEIQVPYNYKDKWTMYTITCSPNGVFTAYVNGSKVGEKNVSYQGVVNQSLAALGRHWWSSGKTTSARFIGSIDEVRLYNRALSEQETSELYSNNTEIQVDVNQTTHNTNQNSDGLIAYYPFDGNANDMSGNGKHATPQNDYRYETGVSGQAIKLTGKGTETSSNVQGGHVLLPRFVFGNSGFTLNIWVKAEGLSKTDGECYINFGNDTEQERLYIIQNQSNIRFCYNKVEIQVPYNYKDKWTMYTITCSPNGVFTAYVNGSKVGEKNVSYQGVVNPSLAALGRHWWNSGRWSSTRFVGSIDEVRLYNRALSEQEINDLYRNVNGK